MSVKRYSPRLDYSECGKAPFDRPTVRMDESTVGKWVAYEDYRRVKEALALLLLMSQRLEN
jgi:hypothetical protein